jgi:hypothetical protein
MGYRSFCARCAAWRKLLYRFHADEFIEQAQQALALGEVSYIPEESAPLCALAQVNQDAVRELGRRCPGQKIATVDLDATSIESWKKAAERTDEGTRGYPPMLALGAELDAVVADEFRDGDGPAQQQPPPVTQRAFAALPETVSETSHSPSAVPYGRITGRGRRPAAGCDSMVGDAAQNVSYRRSRGGHPRRQD